MLFVTHMSIETAGSLKVLFGTPEFVAPEVINYEPISYTTDMWSIGVICYILWVFSHSKIAFKWPFFENGYECLSDAYSYFLSWSLVLFSVSGLSPFMGDNDNETLTNVTSATWDFEDEAFDEISDEAKNFISNLLKKEMKWVLRIISKDHFCCLQNDNLKCSVIWILSIFCWN